MVKLKEPKKVITRLEIAWYIMLVVVIITIAGIVESFPKIESGKAIIGYIKRSHIEKVRIYSDKEIVALDSVYKALYQREGYSDTVYKDKKRFHYIYRGHMLKIGEVIPEHKDTAYGDSLFWSDIIESYRINKRIYEQNLFHNVYKLFVSGHTN